jgi:hypothetical protein
MLRSTVIGTMLASVFASAHAVTWESIYSAPAGTIWVDRSTLKVEHPLVHAKLRMKLDKADNPGDVTYDERIVQVSINCDDWRYSMTSETEWLNGKIVKQWKGDTDYSVIEPGKPLGEAARALCGKAYG